MKLLGSFEYDHLMSDLGENFIDQASMHPPPPHPSGCDVGLVDKECYSV